MNASIMRLGVLCLPPPPPTLQAWTHTCECLRGCDLRESLPSSPRGVTPGQSMLQQTPEG